jgi:hypothetical protein
MEPRDLSFEDVSKLPEHDIVVIAKEQPPYRPLPVARLAGKKGRVVSRWNLTGEERARIAAGEDLYLEVLTFGLPLQPLLPTVGLRVIAAEEVA